MSALTDYSENKYIDHKFRGQPDTVPANVYVALFTSAPSDAGGGTEVSGNGYARVAVPRSLAAWAGTQGAGTTTASTGTGGATSNNAVITFANPTASWGLVTHAALFDALTGGNMEAQGALAAAKTVNTGDPVSFPVGTLTFTLA